jgi:hypothetical protein
MAFGFRFDRLTFSDGTEVQLPASGVVVLVGPNNAGKSAALRELLQRLNVPTPEHVVLHAAEIEKQGDADDFTEWLEKTAFVLDRADGRHFRRPQVGGPVREDVVRNEWSHPGPYGPNIWGFLAFHGAADSRLQLVSGSGPYDPLNDAPGNPMQVLFAQPELELRISDTAYEAFGQRLTLARIWGSNLDLHVGTTDLEPGMPPSPEYIEAIRALPLVHQQGDGVRSFIGLMLALITAQFPIVSVDEPEAFLHPPQARLLGRKLASDVPEGTQVFVATHSADVLQGLLDPADADVTVIRLVRDANVNRAAVLAHESLRDIWGDPLLRYSNVLDGLFHRGVIACEADADSRFYSAVLDTARSDANLPPHDLLFTQSGGKQRLKTIVRALRAVRVPVAVIADFDVLRDEQILRPILESLGGDWDAISADWNQVRAAIDAMGTNPLLLGVSERITQILAEGGEGGRLTRNQARDIRDTIRLDDGWDLTEKSGLGAVSQGQAAERARILLDKLASFGLFVVPVGELERWITDIGGHGPLWVSEVLTQRRHEDPHLPARAFVQRVAAWFD